jgi:sigma-B regulation protein RsbU (phosphoserine phosphatase)
VFYGILNTLNGDLEYVNAGHNPPFILSPTGLKTVELTKGTVLGGIEHFNYKSRRMTIDPGDTLYLYTDGVTEAFNSEGNMYGEKRLGNLLKANLRAGHKEIVKITLADVSAFAAGTLPSDDITLMAIKYFGR